MPPSAPQLEYGPPRDDAEFAAWCTIAMNTYGLEAAMLERYVRIAGRENFRVVRMKGRQSRGRGIARPGGAARPASVVAGHVCLPMGQHFGGTSVPSGGIAIVATAPEHRAGGVASFLMRETVRELRTCGVPLSTLYPATVPVYRRAGYELAGGRHEIRIALPAITVRDRGLAVHEIDLHPDAHPSSPSPINPLREAVDAVYLRRASPFNGTIDRTSFFWARIMQPRGQKARGYAFLREGQADPRTALEGYLWLRHQDLPDATRHPAYSLVLTDVQFTTPEAGRRILAFLASHRSMADAVIFYGGPDHPLLSLLPDRGYTVALRDHWMLRINDVKGALEARGYPSLAKGAECTFAVVDDVLPENSGAYRLTIKRGKPLVARANTKPPVVFDIRGLAQLFAGFASPDDLLATGLLTVRGRTPANRVLATLTELFAPRGGSPWMSDMF